MPIVTPKRTPAPRIDGARLRELVEAARSGDREALNAVLEALIDDVYGLALRMTANVADAEDAAQEVMIKVVTRLDSFRGEASLRTWAYRVAVRHLLDRRKSRVESLALDFARFGADLLEGLEEPGRAEDRSLSEEVKLGCTLAMLTCLDREQRVAFVLGDVFDLPGALAADIAGTSEEVYRQRLSRARKQLEAFTTSFCSIVQPGAPCSCERRVRRAIELGRIERCLLTLSGHRRHAAQAQVKEMESLHATAALFRVDPQFAAPEALRSRIREAITTRPGLFD